jgi:hypothetical protein
MIYLIEVGAPSGRCDGGVDTDLRSVNEDVVGILATRNHRAYSAALMDSPVIRLIIYSSITSVVLNGGGVGAEIICGKYAGHCGLGTN